MFKKQYITKKNQVATIPLSERSRWYFDDAVIAEITSFTHNNEELITVDSFNSPFLIEPFWEDQPVTIPNDPELSELLNLEADEFNKYMRTHTLTMKVRASVLEKLREVHASVYPKYSVVLKAGYRPLEVQHGLFNRCLNYFESKHRDWTQEKVINLTREYVADPNVFIPPHSTGGAVDLTLFDHKQKSYIDMGSPINYPDDRSWTENTDGLTHAQKKNRKLLTNSMIDAGFANLASEWWHFSYGDQHWATYYEHSSARYTSFES